MMSFFRRRMSAANVALVVALVLSMSGGAYAATKYLITSTKQISPKVLKELKGARGEAGAAGPVGPAGPSGAPGSGGAKGAVGTQGPEGKAGATGAEGKMGSTGLEGKAGAEGKMGSTGPEGKAGENVTVKEFSGADGKCGEGGAELSNGTGKALACNGKSAGGTLEKGKTERGTFAMIMTSIESNGQHYGIAQITYPIPLASSTPRPTIEFLGEKETSPNCVMRGAEATAAEGVLCLYVSQSVPQTGRSGEPFYQSPFVNDPFGCDLFFTASSQASYLVGEWALTAG